MKAGQERPAFLPDSLIGLGFWSIDPGCLRDEYSQGATVE